MVIRRYIIFGYDGTIFNIVITPFRDMSDISAVEKRTNDALNLRLELEDWSQSTRFTQSRLSLSGPRYLSGVAAE